MTPARGALPRAGWALASALVTSACSDDGGPRLDSVTPASARANDMVMLTGRRLCGTSGDCASAAGEVQLGLGSSTVRAIVTAYAASAAQIVIPPVAPVGATSLVIVVDERSSNALDFEILP